MQVIHNRRNAGEYRKNTPVHCRTDFCFCPWKAATKMHDMIQSDVAMGIPRLNQYWVSPLNGCVVKLGVLMVVLMAVTSHEGLVNVRECA